MKKIIVILVGGLFLAMTASADIYSDVSMDDFDSRDSGIVVTESNDIILPPEMLPNVVPPVDQESQARDLAVPSEAMQTKNKIKDKLKKELGIDGAVMVIEEKIIKDLINRVTALEIQNHVLQSQLDIIGNKLNISKKMTSAINHVDKISVEDGQTLKEEVFKAEPINGKHQANFYKKINRSIAKLKKQMGPSLFRSIIIGVIIVLVLLLIIILVPKRRKVQSISYPEDDLPIQDQAKAEAFDFSDDKDKSATRLNLARAYIEMGHDSKAQSILYEVLASGDVSEKETAKTLLEKIKQN